MFWAHRTRLAASRATAKEGRRSEMRTAMTASETRRSMIENPRRARPVPHAPAPPCPAPLFIGARACLRPRTAGAERRLACDRSGLVEPVINALDPVSGQASTILVVITRPFVSTPRRASGSGLTGRPSIRGRHTDIQGTLPGRNRVSRSATRMLPQSQPTPVDPMSPQRPRWFRVRHRSWHNPEPGQTFTQLWHQSRAETTHPGAKSSQTWQECPLRAGNASPRTSAAYSLMLGEAGRSQGEPGVRGPVRTR